MWVWLNLQVWLLAIKAEGVASFTRKVGIWLLVPNEHLAVDSNSKEAGLIWCPELKDGVSEAAWRILI